MKTAIFLIAACALLAGSLHSTGTGTATLDQFAQAAMAEIERREGYEGELVTALENCRNPINPHRQDGGTTLSTLP